MAEISVITAEWQTERFHSFFGGVSISFLHETCSSKPILASSYFERLTHAPLHPFSPYNETKHFERPIINVRN